MANRLSMLWQLFLIFGLLIVLVLAILGWLIGSWVEQNAFRQIEDRLSDKVRFLKEFARGRPLLEIRQQLAALKQQTEARVTLIAADGKVLIESDHDRPDSLENHSQRPEVAAALLGKSGSSTRYSSSVGKTMLYVALPGPSGSEVAVVRAGLPLNEVLENAGRFRSFIWAVAGVTGLVALVLAFFLARRLTSPLEELSQGALRIAEGEFGHKVYVDRKDEIGALADSFNVMSLQLASQFSQLEEDRQQLRAVLSSMVEGVIAIDAEQHIVFANERAGQMLEFSQKQSVGRPLWEVVRLRAVQDLLGHAMEPTNGDAHKLEMMGPSSRSLMVHVAPLPGDPVRGAVLVFHDTTELRRLERLRQDFVANVSHELKTPLSVITACVETLQSGAIDDLDHRGRFLERIADQSARLHTLILDLLSLARIESGEEVLHFEACQLHGIIDACAERHQARVRGKNQRLEVQHPANSETLEVWADEEAFCEILDNLVDNAVKYTSEGGVIHLVWWTHGDRCLIEVRDTGIGIPESELARVFERFYRVDKARSREMGGTGLGLSIVKHLVQAMHGTMSVRSVVGQGSVFTVELPIAKSAQQLQNPQ